jgi:hypothetical protein
MANKSFFEQCIEVDSTYKWSDRFDFFKNHIDNKNVLHVGCVDYPITNPNNNLHIQMSKLCNSIDGFDINLTADVYNVLKVENGDLYNKWEDVNKTYDIVLVPAVIEHVNNVQLFLNQLDKIKSNKMIITAPDIFSFKKEQLKHIENNTWVEIVHPDHNCWYSPYTLKNTVNKFLKSYKVTSVFWVLGCVGVVCEKQQ